MNRNDNLEEKIKNKQKSITTNTDLKGWGYTRNGKQNGIQIWIYYTPKYKIAIKEIKKVEININYEDLEKEIKIKIKNKQKCINIDSNISKFGYMRMGLSHGKGKQQWILKSYANELQKKYYHNSIKERMRAKEYRKIYNQTHKKEHREWSRKWRKNNPEKDKEISKKYRESLKGKINEANHQAKRNKKGFEILCDFNYPEETKTEFHHVSPNLPYVIRIPKEIHRSINGRNSNHYIGVVANFYRWLEKHPEIKLEEINI